LIKPKLQCQTDRQIQLCRIPIRKIFDYAIEPELSSQNAKHKLMAKRAIVFADVRVERRQQHRRER
jgi:hypothetical protein